MNENLLISGKKTLSTFFKEEIIEDYQSPSFHHLSQTLSPTHFPQSSSPLFPQSPESLWSHSPSLHPSQNSSLLYCCISSLRHDGDVYSIAVLGDLVLTGSKSRRIHAWQSLDCHTKGYIRTNSGEIRTMITQGNMLFTSHKDHKIRVWNIKSFHTNPNFRPKKVTTLPNITNFKTFIFRPMSHQQHKSISNPINPLHKDIISCMAYYHIEGILYTGSFDKTIKAWRLVERKCIDSFIGHSNKINDMVINQQNGYLFTCSSDGTVKMWLRVYGETSHALIKVLIFHTSPINALTLSTSPSQNHNSFLYSGSFDGSIKFWEQEMIISSQYNNNLGNKNDSLFQGHQFAIFCLVSLDNLVLSGSEDSTIKIFRRQNEKKPSHECVAVLEGHRGPIRCLATLLQKETKDEINFLVFSASLDQTFKVWRVKVLQDQMKNNCKIEEDKRKEDHGGRNKSMDLYEPTPVLSPSWVNWKLHRHSIH